MTTFDRVAKMAIVSTDLIMLATKRSPRRRAEMLATARRLSDQVGRWLKEAV